VTTRTVTYDLSTPTLDPATGRPGLAPLA